jgi:hypothetical protein
MNSLLITAAALTTVLIASGCADAPATSTTPVAREEVIYRTGSNIPVHEKALTKEEKDRQADEARRSLQQIQSTGSGNPKIN